MEPINLNLSALPAGSEFVIGRESGVCDRQFPIPAIMLAPADNFSKIRVHFWIDAVSYFSDYDSVLKKEKILKTIGSSNPQITTPTAPLKYGEVEKSGVDSETKASVITPRKGLKIDLEELVWLARDFEEFLAPRGFHIGITGGCLYKEDKRKDGDFIIYAHSSSSVKTQRGREQIVTMILQMLVETSSGYTEGEISAQWLSGDDSKDVLLIGDIQEKCAPLDFFFLELSTVFIPLSFNNLRHTRNFVVYFPDGTT